MKGKLETELNRLLDDVEVDEIGVICLQDYRNTPAWQQARDMLPGTKSIIVLAVEIFPEVVKYLTSKKQVGELAMRDLFKRNERVISGHIDWEAYKIVRRLHNLGFSALSLPAGDAPYDSRFIEGAFSYKHVAQAAGLGNIGWHSMLITPEYGARVRLALVLTDAPFKPRTLEAGKLPCIKCGGACIKICPVKAISKPRKGEEWNVDKYACANYLNAAESCAECLRVCPAGKKYSI